MLSLRISNKSEKIEFLCVTPGPVESNMTKDLFKDDQPAGTGLEVAEGTFEQAGNIDISLGGRNQMKFVGVMPLLIPLVPDELKAKFIKMVAPKID